jgi:regulation of enolase protein 1 (concanavalin A-like superfamily)
VDTETAVGWTDARWLNEPPAWHVDGSDLLVTAAEGSDFWRTTSYGFVHDNGHGLLTDLPVGAAIEVGFVADFDGRFDQAGVLVWADDETWIKSGLEHSDGELQVGAVVTRGMSDWSLAPVPDWAGKVVTVRASRGPDAITLRARVGDDPWRLIRVAPLTASGPVAAGPLVSAPSRPGLTVRFTRFWRGAADVSLHPAE